MKEKKEIKELERVLKCYFRLGLDSRRLSFFQVADRIRGYSAGNARRARELVAVYELLRFFRAMGRVEIIDTVYYIAGKKDSGEQAQSVLAYSMKNYCDERTVYRRINCILRLYERLLKI